MRDPLLIVATVAIILAQAGWLVGLRYRKQTRRIRQEMATVILVYRALGVGRMQLLAMVTRALPNGLAPIETLRTLERGRRQ